MPRETSRYKAMAERQVVLTTAALAQLATPRDAATSELSTVDWNGEEALLESPGSEMENVATPDAKVDVKCDDIEAVVVEAVVVEAVVVESVVEPADPIASSSDPVTTETTPELSETQPDVATDAAEATAPILHPPTSESPSASVVRAPLSRLLPPPLPSLSSDLLPPSSAIGHLPPHLHRYATPSNPLTTPLHPSTPLPTPIPPSTPPLPPTPHTYHLPITLTSPHPLPLSNLPPSPLPFLPPHTLISTHASPPNTLHLLLSFPTKPSTYTARKYHGKTVYVNGSLVTLHMRSVTKVVNRTFREDEERRRSEKGRGVDGRGVSVDEIHALLYLPDPPTLRIPPPRVLDFGTVLDNVCSVIDFERVTGAFLRCSNGATERGEEGREEGKCGDSDSDGDSDRDSDSDGSVESLTDVLIRQHSYAVDVMSPTPLLNLWENTVSITACYRIFAALQVPAPSVPAVLQHVHVPSISRVIFDPSRLIGSRYLTESAYVNSNSSRLSGGGTRVKVTASWRRLVCKALLCNVPCVTLEVLVRGLEGALSWEEEEELRG